MYKMTMLQIQNTLIKLQHHWKISKMYFTWTQYMLKMGHWNTFPFFWKFIPKSISWICPLLKVKAKVFYSQYESCSKSLAFVHVGPLRTGYVQTRDIGSLPFQDMNKQPFLARCFSMMEISLQRNLLQLHSNREYLIQVYYWRFYVPIVIGVRDPRTNGVKLESPGNQVIPFYFV